MQTVNVSEFGERFLSLLDELPVEGALITKRGRPVAPLMPIRRNSAHLIGKLSGKFEIKGDILSTGEEWDARR